MRATSVVANAIILLTGCGGLTAAMPGPWSVPQEHFEVLALRHAMPLNPDAVTDVRCTDSKAHIVFHDQNAAQLAICDGLGAGAGRTRCRTGGPTTVGERGSARFTLTAAGAREGEDAGAGAAAAGTGTIRLSKTRWEECVRAAREKCPTGSLSGTCRGGDLGGGGDVLFALESTMASAA